MYILTVYTIILVLLLDYTYALIIQQHLRPDKVVLPVHTVNKLYMHLPLASSTPKRN